MTVVTAVLLLTCGILAPVQGHAEEYGAGTYGAGDYNVGRATTTTVLTSSLSPSIVGDSIILTATVTSGSATGTVIFKNGSTTIGSVILRQGSGILVTSNLTAGSHFLTAVYGGNTHYYTSTSATLSQIVDEATSVPASSPTQEVSDVETPSQGGRRGSTNRAITGGGISAPDIIPVVNEISSEGKRLLLQMRERLAGQIERNILKYPASAVFLRRVLERLDARIEERIKWLDANWVSSEVQKLLLNMRARLVIRINQRIREYPASAVLLLRVLERLDARIEVRIKWLDANEN